VKFIRQEIGEIVGYLPDKQKKQTFSASQTVATPRIATKICQQCAQSAQDFIQIGSLSIEL